MRLDLTGLPEKFVALLDLTHEQARAAVESMAHQWEGGFRFDAWKIPEPMDDRPVGRGRPLRPRVATVYVGAFASSREKFAAPYRLDNFDGVTVWETCEP